MIPVLKIVKIEMIFFKYIIQMSQPDNNQLNDSSIASQLSQIETSRRELIMKHCDLETELISEIDKLKEENMKLKNENNNLSKQLKIAEGKLNGVSKLKEKIEMLQSANDKMNETLDFYLIQEGSKMANE